MKTPTTSVAAFLAAAVLISACGESALLDNTPAVEESTSTISATAGTNLSGYYGNYVTGVPQVTVTDKQGQPLAGVAVGFEALGGGRLTGASALTDSAGHASPKSWRLGSSGAQSVGVSVSGARPIAINAAASALPTGTFRIQVRYAAGTDPTAAQRAAFDGSSGM